MMRLLAATLLIVLVGCGSVPELTDANKADVRAYAAAYAASLDAAPLDRDEHKVPRSECRHCRGTGKVKSGDGLAVIECPYCEPESRDGAGDSPRTDAAPVPPFRGGAGVPAVSAPVAEPPAWIPPEPTPIDAEQPEPEPDLLDFAYPPPLGDGVEWTLLDEGEPKLLFIPGEEIAPNELAFDAAVDGFLSHQPALGSILLFTDGTDASKASPRAAQLASRYAAAHWPVCTIDRRAWPELAERFCVEQVPMFVAIRDGRAIAEAAVTDQTQPADLIADAWPDAVSPVASVADDPVSFLRSQIAAYVASGRRIHKGVNGSVPRHLVNEHGWPASWVNQLTPAEQDALHDAVHQRMIYLNHPASGETTSRPAPSKTSARTAAPAGNCPNCRRPEWNWRQ